MTDTATIAQRYIAVWNETNPERRRAMLADGLTPNAAYVDPLARAEGYVQINALLDSRADRLHKISGSSGSVSLSSDPSADRVTPRRRMPLGVGDWAVSRNSGATLLNRLPHPEAMVEAVQPPELHEKRGVDVSSPGSVHATVQ